MQKLIKCNCAKKGMRIYRKLFAFSHAPAAQVRAAGLDGYAVACRPNRRFTPVQNEGRNDEPLLL